MSALEVAVWGLGPHALKNIVPALQDSPGVRLYGVCSRDEQTVAKTAGDAGCKGWRDPAQMLADRAVDAVYVSTPIALHATHGCAVLSAGKHLWCEKPIAASGREANTLLVLSRERGVTIGEGFMYLYHPQFARLREVLKSGLLGSLRTVSCRFGIPPLERPGFRNDPALGGGAFLDVGSYPISALISLFPDSNSEVLFAEIVTAPGSGVDTAGRAVLRLENGVCAVLEWGINCAYRSEIDLWGQEGSVSSERVFSKPPDYAPTFRFRGLRGGDTTETGQPANHFLAMIQTFRDFVHNRDNAERERDQIARRVALIDAIRERSHT